MSSIINIRSTYTEKNAIQNRAEALGKSVTDYLLDLAAKDAGFVRETRKEGKQVTKSDILSFLEWHDDESKNGKLEDLPITNLRAVAEHCQRHGYIDIHQWFGEVPRATLTEDGHIWLWQNR